MAECGMGRTWPRVGWARHGRGWVYLVVTDTSAAIMQHAAPHKRTGAMTTQVIDMSMDMRTDMSMDMRIDMSMDMRMDMCADMHTDMCADMHIDLCSDMRIDMCVDMR